MRLVHAGRLHDATLFRQVAVQHGQAAVLGIGAFLAADAARLAVGVQRQERGVLAEGDRGRDAAGRRAVELFGFFAGVAGHVPLLDGVAQRAAVHVAAGQVQQIGARQFTQDAQDATGAVHVFDVVLVGGGRRLAQARHLARDAVDIGHGEVHTGFLRRGQQVQHGVGRTAHRHVQRHRVLERALGGDVARQDGFVFFDVVAAAQVNDQAAGLFEQPLAPGVRGDDGAVARQRQADGFGQAVHRVGSEHAGTGAAGRAGAAFDFGDFRVRHVGIGGLDHGVDQVDLGDDLAVGGRLDLARFHRAAGHEHDRDVQAHRGHQHPRGDLVAVRDADHGVGAVRVDHVFHRVRDEFARRQRIQHAAVTHGDAVVHGDGVEFFGDAAGGFDFLGHQRAQVAQVHVAGDELRERVHHGDDRLAEVAVLHAGGAPQGAGAGHVAAVGRSAGAVVRHDLSQAVAVSVGGKTVNNTLVPPPAAPRPC